MVAPRKRLPEGPYGEYSRTYGPGSNSPILEVRAITMGKNPIYRHIFAAHREHNYTGLLAREAIIYAKVKAAVPSIRAVHMLFGGLCRNVAYVSIKKEFDGAGRLVALTALTGDTMLKQVAVVEENISVFYDSNPLGHLEPGLGGQGQLHDSLCRWEPSGPNFVHTEFKNPEGDARHEVGNRRDKANRGGNPREGRGPEGLAEYRDRGLFEPPK